MLTTHFTFQNDKHNFILFTPVVENHLGEGDEAFLPDYPKNILLSKDLELVPWMVGLTSFDGALVPIFFPEIYPAGETKLYIKNVLIIFCHLGTVMVTISRRACHLKLF
jgi:hypothetical protein